MAKKLPQTQSIALKQPALLKIAESESANDEVVPLRIIKQNQASKLSPVAPGILTYAIGLDDATQAFYIRLKTNASGGYFSQEWVPIQNIHACLQSVGKTREIFGAILLKSAFVSRSQNNAGFLAAVLKVEGVLHSAVDKVNGLQFTEDRWLEWQKHLAACNRSPTAKLKQPNP